MAYPRQRCPAETDDGSHNDLFSESAPAPMPGQLSRAKAPSSKAAISERRSCSRSRFDSVAFTCTLQAEVSQDVPLLGNPLQLVPHLRESRISHNLSCRLEVLPVSISLYHHVSHLRELQNTGRNFLLAWDGSAPSRRSGPARTSTRAGQLAHRAPSDRSLRATNVREAPSHPWKGPETGLGLCHSLGATALVDRIGLGQAL